MTEATQMPAKAERIPPGGPVGEFRNHVITTAEIGDPVGDHGNYVITTAEIDVARTKKVPAKGERIKLDDALELIVDEYRNYMDGACDRLIEEEWARFFDWGEARIVRDEKDQRFLVVGGAESRP